MGRYYRGYTVKNTRISNLKYAAAPLALGLALISTPSFAQDAAAEEEAPASEIVVTGSLIQNPNLERSSPVNVTSSEEIELLQSNLAEEVLREIPGVVPSIGSAVNNGNGGASFVNLRGLGSNRNIVLLDGNRIVPAGFGGQVDLNNVPLALVERVDVLTGGASTTYGADAVGGVVNFILKGDFAGMDLLASEQITEQGDGNVARVDLTIGANFDDGRGNAVFGVGYQQADPVYQGARDVSLTTIDTFSGTAIGSGTSFPSRFSGGRLVSGTANGGTNQLNDAGQLVPTFATFNFNPYNVFQVPFERFNMFGQARYEVSDAVEVYTRGLFSKNTVSTIIAPSGAFSLGVNIPLNNPFLPAAARNQFCAFDVNPSATVYTPRFTPAECAAAASGTLRPGDAAYREIGLGGFVPFDVNGNGRIEAGEGYNPNPQSTFARRAIEAGPRISEYVTTIFDYRIGARGAITDSIDWDVNGAYGESENLSTIKGYTLNSRFRQSLRAGGTAAAPVCFDTSNGCVPANVFGNIQPQAIPFLVQESSSFTKTSLAQVKGTINGDAGFSSPFSEDPVAFAVGGEFRKYTARQGADSLARSGDLGGAGGATPNIVGGFNVYEAFGELVVPVVSEKPFFHSLTVEGGVRYSSYSVDAPGNPSFNTTTFKGGGTWEPVDGLAIRGNYARAVRAPNIGELFSPVNTGLTNLGTDPCATLNTAGAVLPGRPATGPTGELRAVCLAQGANLGNINTIPQPNSGQVNSTGGGNVNIKPEKSDSYTIGAILQPAALPGFSASIDYYNIKVTRAISSPTPGDVIAACFGSSVFNPPAGASTSPACTSIRRSPADGGLSGDANTFTGLPSTLSNSGSIETDGIDLIVNYKTDLTDNIGLALSFNGNYTFNSKFNAFVFNPDSVNRDCTGYFSSNCGSLQPDFQWSQRTTLSFESIDVSLLWRHMSSMEQEPLDVIDSGAFFNGTVGASIPGVGGRTVNFGKIKAYDYFDLSTRFKASENMTFTFSVQNLLDKAPPLTGNNAGSTTFNSGNTFPSSYDALGRRYAVSAKLSF
ncbi:TonB-dependent receptor domain-containing protein [Sphingorhabdus sp.]|uniref:TonB-dependent receptor domain-containing protein n=1 Tax=Sphingorhabdus sp. TaxID=1902408 RepID=UPI0039838707